MAHLLTKELKESILQAAIEGKLSNKNCTDTPVQSTLKKIKELQDSLFKNKIEKPTKPTREVNDIELFDIPEHWQWVELSQIGTMTRGSGIKKTEVTQTGFPCVRYGQLYTTFKEKFDKAVSFVPEDIFKSCKKAHQGDVLMSLTGENNFDIALAVVYEGLEEIAIGGDMMKLSNHCMNPYYLSFVLNSEYGINWKRKMAKGNIIVHISTDKLANIMIPTPPIEEQARIVSKVDEIMGKIDEYEKLENQLVKLKEQFPEDMKASLLQAAMQGKLTEQLRDDTPVNLNLIKQAKNKQLEESDIELPKNWSKSSIEGICESISSKKYQIKNSQVLKDGKYKVVSQSQQGVIGYSNSADKLFSHELPVITFGDHTTIVKLIDFDFVVGADGLKIFKPNGIVVPKYFYYSLEQLCNGLENVGGYTRHYKYIKNKPLPIPPIEEQQRIVDKLDKLLPLVDRLAELN